MKPVNVIVVCAFVVVSAIGCATNTNFRDGTSPISGSSPAATATPDEFAAVRPIYKEHCSKCHGENGDGGQVTVDGKKIKVPSLKADHALKHSDEDFVDQITDGGGGMPAFKRKLKPRERHDLVRFIRKEMQLR